MKRVSRARGFKRVAEVISRFTPPYKSVCRNLAAIAGATVALVAAVAGVCSSTPAPNPPRVVNQEAVHSPQAHETPEPLASVRVSTSNPSSVINNNNFNLTPAPPPQTPPPEKRPPVISMPAAQGGRRIDESVYAVLPRISCRITDDKSLPSQFVTVRCARSSTQGGIESLPAVDAEFLDIKLDPDQAHQTVEFRFADWMNRQGASNAASGTYCIRYDAVDSDLQPASPRQFEVTYVRPVDVSNPAQFMFESGLDFLKDRQLVTIKNLPGKRFIWAKLRQPLDFQNQLRIRGRFRYIKQQPASPPALDVALCDHRGERVACIIADGGLNSHTLKLVSDGTGRGSRPKPKSSRPIKPGLHYYFLLTFTRMNRSWVCQLCLGQDLDTLEHQEVVNRVGPSEVIPPGDKWLLIKLWREGAVQLDKLEVVECN